MALGEEVGDAYIEVHADTSPFSRELREELAEAEGATDDSNRRRRLANARFYEDMSEDRRSYFRDEITRLTRSNRQWTRWANGNSRSVARFREAVRGSFGDLDDIDHDAFSRALDSMLRDGERLFTQSGSRSGDNFNRGFLGRLRGARNDFANAVGVLGGSIERSVSNLVTGAFTLFGEALDRLGTQLTSMSSGSGPLSAFGGALSGLGSSLSGLTGGGGLTGFIIALAGVALGVAAAAASLGPLVAGLSALIGIATALASVLTFALGGALLSLGPILGSLAAGFGGVVYWLTTLQQGTGKKATTGLQYLLAQLDNVGMQVGKLLPNFDQWKVIVGDIVSAIQVFIPLMAASVKAILSWAHSFTTYLQGPDMAKNLAVFGKTWPGILSNLLDTFTSIFSAIMAVMRAISPTVEDVTGNISDAAAQFAAWANSAGGQTSIQDFFEKSAKAAGQLWDIIKNVGTILGEVFGSGETSGAGFLTVIDALTAHWADFLGTKEGQDALKQWFSDARGLAESLGGALLSIGTWLDSLDTPKNRKTFEDLVNGIDNLIAAWTVFTNISSNLGLNIFQDLAGLVAGISAAASAISSVIGDIPGWWNTAVSAVEGAWDATVAWIQRTWDSFYDSVTGTVGSLWDGLVSGLETAWNSVTGTLSTLWDGFIGGLQTAWQAVSDFWNDYIVPAILLWSQPMADFWSAFWAPISKWLSDQWAEVTAYWDDTVVPWFNGLVAGAGAIWTAFWSHITDGISDGWNAATGWWDANIQPYLDAIWTYVSEAWTTAWSHITDGIDSGWASVTNWWNNNASPWLGDIWSSVSGAFSGAWQHISDGVSSGWSNFTSWWNAHPGNFLGDIWSSVSSAFSKAWSHITDGLSSGWSGFTSWWSNTAWPWLQALPGRAGDIGGNLVVSILQGIKDSFWQIPSWIGDQFSKMSFHIPGLPDIPGIPFLARGAVVSGRTHAVIGEDGPEAVVPLSRNLNQVDPSVRWLSAIAQGKVPGMASGGVAGGAGGVTVESGAIQVVSPYANPALVAEDVMDALATRFR